jgi:VCBS repeat-containing protein
MKTFFLKIKYLFILSIISLLTFSFNNFKNTKTEYVYIDEIKGKKTETIWTIDEKDNQIYIEGSNPQEKISIVTDSNYAFQNFNYINTSKKTDYKIKRINNILQCSGQIKNSKIADKDNNIGKTPWVQQFCFGLKKISISNENSYIFYSVNPKNFSVNKIQAKKKNIENITINNKNYKAQKITVSLTGFKSLFWSAQIWFDVEDGTMLLYKGNEGPNTPTTTVTFKSKK